MPSVIEVAFYQFGIRLQQCRRSYFDYTGEVEQDAGVASLAVAANRVRYSIALLEQASQYLTLATQQDRGSIQKLIEAWNDVLDPPNGNAQGIFSPLWRFGESLDDLEEAVWRCADSLETKGAAAATWLDLGLKLSFGFVRQKGSERIWNWSWGDRLIEATRRAGITLEELCPTVPSHRDGVPLAYDQDKYWIWFFIEEGLSRLMRKIPLNKDYSGAVRTSIGNLEQSSSEDIRPEDFEDLRKIKEEIDPEGKYIGQSLALLRMFEEIRRYNSELASVTDGETKSGKPKGKLRPIPPLLILGESGTGKSELANLIHTHSHRSGKYYSSHGPDTRASDPKIVQHDWAGHGKNSGLPNTGTEAQEGYLQENAKGTIFLDEIHDAPEEFQRYLFPVLDRNEMHVTSGVAAPFVPDVRMIFASNLPHDKLSEVLLHDMWRRIHQRSITVPPLRERIEDVLEFVDKECPDHTPDPKFLLALLLHDWPDNVGGLLTRLSMAKAKAAEKKSTRLTLECLDGMRNEAIRTISRMSDDEAEKEIFIRLIEIFKGQGFQKGTGLQKKIAECLKLRESTVSRKMGKLGI